MNVRKVLRWFARALDYRTFAVAGAFLTLLLVAYIILVGSQAAHDASVQQGQARRAATRRIDLLSAEIARLQRQLLSDSEDRARLSTAVAALAAQVRQLGGQPVLTISQSSRRTPTSASSPVPTRPRPAPRPSPRPTRTTKPRAPASPHPSPTCTRLPILGTCVKIGTP